MTAKKVELAILRLLASRKSRIFYLQVEKVDAVEHLHALAVPQHKCSYQPKFQSPGSMFKGFARNVTFDKKILEMPAYLAFINEFVLIFISEDYISENIYPILVTGHLT